MPGDEKLIQFYATITSPWAYLAARRLAELSERTGCRIELSLIPTILENGWQPYAMKPKAKQDYVRIEVARWSRHLGIPLRFEGKPDISDPEGASRMVIAAQLAGGGHEMALLTELQAAYWARWVDIGVPEHRIALASSIGLDGPALFAAERGAEVTRRWEHNRDKALADGIFGVPTFVYEGERYWGQDRLDFLRRHIEQGHPA